MPWVYHSSDRTSFQDHHHYFHNHHHHHLYAAFPSFSKPSGPTARFSHALHLSSNMPTALPSIYTSSYHLGTLSAPARQATTPHPHSHVHAVPPQPYLHPPNALAFHPPKPQPHAYILHQDISQCLSCVCYPRWSRRGNEFTRAYQAATWQDVCMLASEEVGCFCGLALRWERREADAGEERLQRSAARQEGRVQGFVARRRAG